MIDHETNGVSLSDTYTIRGGLQCDDMGLGKTIQVVGTIVNNPRESTLIICPLATIEQWHRVIQTVCDQFNVLRTHKNGKTVSWRETGASSCPLKRSIYLTHYEVVQRNQYLVKGRWWDRIVVDEAHRLCGRGVLFRLLQTIRSTIRWAITGTPIVNRSRDIYTLLMFLGIREPKKACPQEFIIRRNMDELRGAGAGFVPFKPIISCIKLRPSRQELDLLENVRTREYTPKIVGFMRMRQASAHPKLVSPEFPTENTRVRAVCDEVCGSGGNDRKFLVFCQFTKEIQILLDALRLRGLCRGSIEVYDGSLAPDMRTDTIARAKKDACKVLLMQIQAGGVGLNLQEFDTCIFTSPWWTSALMDQAVARCVRIGQTKTVRVVFLINEEDCAIDNYVLEAANTKKQLLGELFEEKI